MTIRIGIMGYGNLGRGVECAIKQNPDMELAAVFTRRDPKNVRILTEGAKVYHADEAKHMTDKIDVLILCGGSATDLPVQDTGVREILYRSGQLRYTRENSGALCSCRCSGKGSRKCSSDLRRLGSGYVLLKSCIRKRNSPGW